MVPPRGSLPGRNDWDAQVDLQFSIISYHKWTFFTISESKQKIQKLMPFFNGKGWVVKGIDILNNNIL